MCWAQCSVARIGVKKCNKQKEHKMKWTHKLEMSRRRIGGGGSDRKKKSSVNPRLETIILYLKLLLDKLT